jgi:glutaredoxin 3
VGGVIIELEAGALNLLDIIRVLFMHRIIFIVPIVFLIVFVTNCGRLLSEGSQLNTHDDFGSTHQVVTLYSIAGCGYCSAAKSLFNKHTVAYKEILINPDDNVQYSNLIKKSGMQSFPQIFYGEQLIGGYDDLKRLSSSHDLKKLLK